MGRKKGILLCLGIAIIGMLIIGFSQNLVMAGIGLFLTGFGINSAQNVCFFFITETVENKLRQKYTILLEAFF